MTERVQGNQMHCDIVWGLDPWRSKISFFIQFHCRSNLSTGMPGYIDRLKSFSKVAWVAPYAQRRVTQPRKKTLADLCTMEWTVDNIGIGSKSIFGTSWATTLMVCAEMQENTCVNQACTRARVTQPSPNIFLHICTWFSWNPRLLTLVGVKTMRGVNKRANDWLCDRIIKRGLIVYWLYSRLAMVIEDQNCRNHYSEGAMVLQHRFITNVRGWYQTFIRGRLR